MLSTELYFNSFGKIKTCNDDTYIHAQQRGRSRLFFFFCQFGAIASFKIAGPPDFKTFSHKRYRVPEVNLRQDLLAKISCLNPTRAVHLHQCKLISLLVKRREIYNTEFHPFLSCPLLCQFSGPDFGEKPDKRMLLLYRIKMQLLNTHTHTRAHVLNGVLFLVPLFRVTQCRRSLLWTPVSGDLSRAPDQSILIGFKKILNQSFDELLKFFFQHASVTRKRTIPCQRFDKNQASIKKKKEKKARSGGDGVALLRFLPASMRRDSNLLTLASYCLVGTIEILI